MVRTAAAGTAPRVVSGEDLFAMGDVGPCELIDGRVVPKSPTGKEHAIIEVNVAVELRMFAAERGLGTVMVGEVGICTARSPDRVRAADVVLISDERLRGEDTPGYLRVAPEVVFEILSPADPWQEVRRKLEEYFEIGVEQAWIVEPANRAVLVYRSPTAVAKYEGSATLGGAGILEGLSLEVARLFAN